jgi:hypothetical protein
MDNVMSLLDQPAETIVHEYPYCEQAATRKAELKPSDFLIFYIPAKDK